VRSAISLLSAPSIRSLSGYALAGIGPSVKVRLVVSAAIGGAVAGLPPMSRTAFWPARTVGLQVTVNAAVLLDAATVAGSGLMIVGLTPNGTSVETAISTISSDPLRESAHRVLIEAYLAEGNLAEGRRAYDRYRAIATRELGVEPGRELTSLVRPAPPDRQSLFHSERAVAHAPVASPASSDLTCAISSRTAGSAAG
jgi:hypothetical protein